MVEKAHLERPSTISLWVQLVLADRAGLLITGVQKRSGFDRL